ncbi:shikimate dehydrogenase [Terasakiella sp. A23]|uniref:shikimate dehydrogenase n=1 Tax=Terasakiella sp. FCG-A23 TaxID=3080561 RepID=UPI002954B6EE|nr:shikimate dehydrogenase [Terasakiella sp. A23]MDV7339891.1 shikimate dehydrogenase [Terasakiella sp. A23]
MILSGKAKLAGVMGWPISHSKSPRLHGFWLEKYGIDGTYVPLAVKPDDFAKAVHGLQAAGFAGVNVTVPHKENALKIADEVSDRAAKIGASNTLIFKEDGSIYADNTDGYGFFENLVKGAPGWKAEAGPAVVLGAGGAARAILIALAEAGVPEIRLTNRTRARAENLAGELNAPITVVDWEERNEALAGTNLLTNTTTLGMTGQGLLEIELFDLPKSALVNDIVYAPLHTNLLEKAHAHGCDYVDGLGMLLHQARPGFKAWFGTDPEVDEDLRQFVLED